LAALAIGIAVIGRKTLTSTWHCY